MDGKARQGWALCAPERCRTSASGGSAAIAGPNPGTPGSPVEIEVLAEGAARTTGDRGPACPGGTRASPRARPRPQRCARAPRRPRAPRPRCTRRGLGADRPRRLPPIATAPAPRETARSRARRATDPDPPPCQRVDVVARVPAIRTGPGTRTVMLRLASAARHRRARARRRPSAPRKESMRQLSSSAWS